MKKRKIELAVISDVHLGTPDCRAEELLVYLSSIKPKMLVLNGDFIDARDKEGAYFPKSHIKVIKKVLSMLADGTKVYYLSGGHDEFLRKFNSKDLSKLSVRDRVILDLDGKTTCILHGEVFDTSSAMVKWINRIGPAGYRTLCLVHRMKNWFYRRFRGASANSESGKDESLDRDETNLNRFDMNAVELALQNGYDTIICGYSHLPKKVMLENSKGQCLYLNSGDWVEHLTALEYSFKRWKLYNFKLDKLTAFYGDEELKELDLPDMLQKLMNPGRIIEKPRTTL